MIGRSTVITTGLVTPIGADTQRTVTGTTIIITTMTNNADMITDLETPTAETIIIDKGTSTGGTRTTIRTRTTEGMTTAGVGTTLTLAIVTTTEVPPTIPVAKHSHTHTTADPRTFGSGTNDRTTTDGDHPTTIAEGHAPERADPTRP